MDWLSTPLFTVGDTRVTAGRLVSLTLTLVVVVIVARLAGNLVGARLLRRTAMDRGLQYALGRMVYYALLVTGLMIALQTSGIQVGSLAVVLGALGVGIGFGLQHVVNNFVSGLILLVERPVKVGDWIEVDGTGGLVERIGARSTTIVTNDNVTIIVPNGELVTKTIVNWSHGHPRVRIRLPVSAAYGSDLEVVRAALLEVAGASAMVLDEPAPAVNFLAFAESALELELAVWTREMVHRQRRFRSELNFAIDAAFRARGIVIPFPQREVRVMGASPPREQDGPRRPPPPLRSGRCGHDRLSARTTRCRLAGSAHEAKRLIPVRSWIGMGRALLFVMNNDQHVQVVETDPLRRPTSSSAQPLSRRWGRQSAWMTAGRRPSGRWSSPVATAADSFPWCGTSTARRVPSNTPR